jgi:hypothetical protein
LTVWHWLEVNHPSTKIWDERRFSASYRDVAASEIALNKHHIDTYNQQRNGLPLDALMI